MSALLLARGLAGQAGKVVLIDSESGRGSLYADVIPGGYETLELREPFSPSRYIEAIKVVEESKADVLVIDSASHEHEGLGGLLDMAAENEAKSGKPGLHNWKVPKMEHSKFMLKLLQSTMPIIVCLRAKYKTRQTKDEKNRTVIVKDEKTSPIASEDFIYEMTAHFEILQNHAIYVTKISHPSLRECFPKDGNGMIETRHGELLANWCAAGGKPVTNKQPNNDVSTLKKELWEITKRVHKGDEGHFRQHLVDDLMLDPDKQPKDLTSEELKRLIEKAKQKASQLL